MIVAATEARGDTETCSAKKRDNPIWADPTRTIIGSPSEIKSIGRPTQMPKLRMRHTLSRGPSIAEHIHEPTLAADKLPQDSPSQTIFPPAGIIFVSEKSFHIKDC